MKIPFLRICMTLLALLAFGCGASVDGTLVTNKDEFDKAVANAKAGDRIVLANGIWKDVELVFSGQGEEEKPIILTVEEKGKVVFEGQSNLQLSGSWLHVEGLVFRNGYTPTGEVISFKHQQTPANHSRVTECVIDDYNPSERFESDYWVAMYGKHNRFDHNYLIGKRNQGVTLAVRMNGEAHQENFHRIDHNYFGYHQILGSNGGETLRIGTSHFSLKNSNTTVEDNYFEWCNGEHEIISNKSCHNTFRNNTFYECQGTLTMRHGNETRVENNYFFGNGKANTGGIRIINESQTVNNNYCTGLTGYRFRGALVIMNGVPNSPLNRYFQVKNSSASNNLILDCDYVQLCAGSDGERSAVPVNSSMSDNVIYNEHKDEVFTVYDDVSGIRFANNYLSPNIVLPTNKGTPITEGFIHKALTFKEEKGLKRCLEYPEVGPDPSLSRPDRDNTGVSWYPKKDYSIRFNTGKEIIAAAGENSILDAVRQSSSGDVIVLSEAGEYHATKAIDIHHPLTIRAAAGLTAKPVLTFERSSLFNIENGGSLSLQGLEISGTRCDDKPNNTVIRTSRYSMINNYKLTISDCDFHDLDVNHSFNVVMVYKNTFADSITMLNSTFRNITGHVLALDKEIDDIGIYNVEDVLIEGCQFEDIGGVVLKLHRGGSDESTFGPILVMGNSGFDNVGHDKRNRDEAAISLHGVQKADIHDLQFNASRKIDLYLTVGEPVIELEKYSAGRLRADYQQ
ncbi:MAG: chondroitinase-B domain-containing protein [Bacteroidia bacterium]